MSGFIPAEYRQTWWGSFDPLLRRTLSVSGGLGLVVLVAVLAAPVHLLPLPDVEDMPERFARLILKESPPRTSAPLAEVEETAPAPAMAEAVIPEPPSPPPVEKVREAPEVVAPTPATPNPAPEPAKTPQRGAKRAREEVSSSLAGLSASAGDALKGLSASLTTPGSSDTPPARRGGRRRGVSRGRTSGQLASVEVNARGGGAPEGTTQGLGETRVGIESPQAIRSGTGGGAAARADGGGDGASGRSRASLLAVVRRYAAGIEYCYDNQLKRDPDLRGKLTVAITVGASGEVLGTRVVSDTAGSTSLRQCVLGQIEDWRFPPVAGPDVAFDAPFVFTPPR